MKIITLQYYDSFWIIINERVKINETNKNLFTKNIIKIKIHIGKELIYIFKILKNLFYKKNKLYKKQCKLFNQKHDSPFEFKTIFSLERDI